MYIFIILLILFLLVLSASSKQLNYKTKIVIKDKENVDLYPYERIHDYYNFNPDYYMKNNSFVSFNVSDINIYKPRSLSANKFPCSIEPIISSDCINKKMIETKGSIKKSIEQCSKYLSQSANCLNCQNKN